MSIILRIVFIILILMYMIFLIKSIKKKKMQISFSVFWILSPIVLIIAIAFPNLVFYISKSMGFETTANMIFVVTIFILYCLVFDLTLKLSQEHKKNVAIVQELSILKAKIDKFEKERKD